MHELNNIRVKIIVNKTRIKLKAACGLAFELGMYENTVIAASAATAHEARHKVCMSSQISMFDDSSDDESDPRLASIPDVRTNDPGTLGHAVFLALATGPVGARAIVERGAHVMRERGVSGQPMEAGRLHVSLYEVANYVDRFPRREIASALRAADRLALDAFDVVFDRVAKFGDGRAFVFKASPNEPLTALHACRIALGMSLADTGRKTTAAKTSPHMTFAYGTERFDETPIEPLRWRAERLLLIDSHVHGHRHEVLGEWALRA